MSDPKRHFIEWDQIVRDAETLARKMDGAGLVTSETKGFVALARGGLSFAQMLGHFFKMRRIETVTLLARSDARMVIEPEIVGTPSPDLGDGSGWIVVDDLVDTGESFRFLKKRLPKAVYVAAYAKPHGEKEAAIVVQTFPQDVWLDFPWEVDPLA